MTSKAEQKRIEKNEAITRIKVICTPGTKLVCLIREVSRRSGTAFGDVFAIKNNELVCLSFDVRDAGRLAWSGRRNCIQINEVGTHRGFILARAVSDIAGLPETLKYDTI